MKRSIPRREVPRSEALTLGILFLLAAVVASEGCGKKETPAAGAPAAAAVAATPTPAPNIAPVIHETAVAGLSPYADLAEPRGAAVDAQGRLWVADFGHSRVAIFDPRGGYLGGWGGGRGNLEFQLQEPASIAIHGTDIYVADTWNGRIQHFTTAGEYRETTLAGLYGPRGVAVGPDGSLWIADSGNDRLILCPRGACSKPLQTIGNKGKDSDAFASPIGIAVGPSGSVYVADIGNGRMQVLSSQGRFTRSFPVEAWTGPMEPYVQVDDREHVFISVPAAAVIEELDRSGRVLKTWSTDDQGGKFSRPTGLALDHKKGILYVMNSGSNTIAALRLAGK
ncbi:MAG TPA: NHL repeat-containing protein [Thermoanaerobaculia bacterium]|nr:NHL repeat-containing protein [Thermoanaerobaculia bacterium]